MRYAEPVGTAGLKGKLLLWLRRGFDIMVVGAMVLALLETVSYLTGLTRGLVG